MNYKKYLTMLCICCIVSYLFMNNLSLTEGVEKTSISNTNKTTIDPEPEMKPEVKKEDLSKEPIIKEADLSEKMINFIVKTTGLPYEDCNYILEQCTTKNVDIYLLLGLMKKESDFITDAVGESGEIGLGQLMENTAQPIAQNLGYKYDKDMLFNPRYNIEFTTSQLSYLKKIYKNDIHKTLTAYNRGQQGLEKYMELKKSSFIYPAMSEYSLKVLKFAQQFKEEFEKFAI